VDGGAVILSPSGDAVEVVRVATRSDAARVGFTKLSFRELQSGRWLLCRRISARRIDQCDMLLDRYQLLADRGQREIKEALQAP